MADNIKEEVEQTLKAQFERQFKLGVRVGIRTASQVISDKLSDRRKPLMDRIRDVEKFCNVATKNEDFLNVSVPESTKYDE